MMMTMIMIIIIIIIIIIIVKSCINFHLTFLQGTFPSCLVRTSQERFMIQNHINCFHEWQQRSFQLTRISWFTFSRQSTILQVQNVPIYHSVNMPSYLQRRELYRQLSAPTAILLSRKRMCNRPVYGAKQTWNIFTASRVIFCEFFSW